MAESSRTSIQALWWADNQFEKVRITEESLETKGKEGAGHVSRMPDSMKGGNSHSFSYRHSPGGFPCQTSQFTSHQ
jgi:hypothetical protein